MRLGLSLGAGGRTGGGFLPTAIANIEAWYRADLGITLNGSNVAGWADQTGTDANKNLAQSTAARQPAYNAVDAGYNGKPTVQFTKASVHYMFSGTWTSAPTTVGTTFLVMELDATGVQVPFCLSVTGNGIGELYGNGGGVTDLHYYAGADISIPNEVDFTAKHVYAVERNGASTKVYQDAKTALVTADGGNTAMSGIIIGANSDAGANPATCKIPEIISYARVLSPAELGTVLDYLGGRYGITIGA